MSVDRQTRVCVPLRAGTLSELTAAVAKVSGVADLIELRVDALEPGELRDPAQLQNLIKNVHCPVVLTFRSTSEGGYRQIRDDERQTFWKQHLNGPAAFFDLEYDLISQLTNLDPEQQPDWSRVICSHHDFKGVPANLDDIYDRIDFTPARILKIAVKANDIVDCLKVFTVLDRAQREDKELIAIAMDEAGVITRILGPARGSFLTYGASEAEQGTAPGQIVADELKSIYRIQQIDSDTMITGLVGAPVRHSVSPHMHNAAYAATRINGVYLPLEVRDLENFIRQMVHPRSSEMNWNLRGVSVTAPHKLEVMKFLDWIEPEAQTIGAVNTIVVQNEQLFGYNTDAAGFIEPLTKCLGPLSGMRAAVLGAGGAASAAVFALQQQGVDVTLYARNLEKVQTIARGFNVSYDSLTNGRFRGFDVVVNTTPLGSAGLNVDETPVTAEQLQGSRLAYDLVYNPSETLFMREAKRMGCEVLGGLEMLVAQAQLQFKLWTKMNVPSELMNAAATAALTKNFPRLD